MQRKRGFIMARAFDSQLIKFLDKKIIATKAEMVAKLGCSGVTVTDILRRKATYLTSYTHNRKYYALVSNLNFDENGCCFYKEVGFREKGTIKNTILDKINNSEAGMRSSEIEEILNKVGRDVLARLHVAGRVSSQLIGTVRYYFNSEQDIRVLQIAERQNIYQKECEEEDQISHETVLFVVGVCLRTKHLPAKKIYQKLKKMGINISMDEVKRIMDNYELEQLDKQVKKTLDATDT